MARLLSHPLDHVRTCLACGAHAAHRYEGAQILDTAAGAIVEARIVTCSACGTTRAVDTEPRPGLTVEDLLRVTDRRCWARLRAARERGAA